MPPEDNFGGPFLGVAQAQFFGATSITDLLTLGKLCAKCHTLFRKWTIFFLVALLYVIILVSSVTQHYYTATKKTCILLQKGGPRFRMGGSKCCQGAWQPLLPRQLRYFMLATYFSMAFDRGIFPNFFKIAKVIPVFKSGSKDQANNYHLISLLPNLSKVLEKLIKLASLNFLKNIHLFMIIKMDLEISIVLCMHYLMSPLATDYVL